VYTGGEPKYGEEMEYKGTYAKRIIDSFRENERGAQMIFNVSLGPDNLDVETGLSRKLKGRHLQMIAIGGSIGTGLFVASGKALATGGPASLLISFSLIGLMLYCTVHALGELAVAFPVSGSFSAYSTRFIDPAWGFAMGWK
jgi:amino acid transporter